MVAVAEFNNQITITKHNPFLSPYKSLLFKVPNGSTMILFFLLWYTVVLQRYPMVQLLHPMVFCGSTTVWCFVTLEFQGTFLGFFSLNEMISLKIR